MQNTVNDGTPGGFSGSQNGLTAARNWSSNNPSGPGLGLGWGMYQPTEWFVKHFRTDPDGLPYLDMFETYPYEIKDDYLLDPAPSTGTDPFTPDTCGLDPRLDWTVGRRVFHSLDMVQCQAAIGFVIKPMEDLIFIKNFTFIKIKWVFTPEKVMLM